MWLMRARRCAYCYAYNIDSLMPLTFDSPKRRGGDTSCNPALHVMCCNAQLSEASRQPRPQKVGGPRHDLKPFDLPFALALRGLQRAIVLCFISHRHLQTAHLVYTAPSPDFSTSFVLIDCGG